MIKNSSIILRKGFTLIELLVVIAIIGVLSSVVLASLRQSNQKASDAKVKSQLRAMIAPAQLYYDTTGNNRWDSVCLVEPMDSMKKSVNATCQGTGQIGWRAVAPLTIQNQHTSATPGPGSGIDYWCVDYTAATMICDTAPTGTYGGVYSCNTTSPEFCK